MQRAAAWRLAPVLVALVAAGCGSSPAPSGANRTTGQATSASSPAASATPGLPSAGAVTATVPSLGAITTPDDNYGMAADGSSVWVYNGGTGMVTRVGEQSGTVTARVQLRPGCKTGVGCGNVAIGEGAAWIANDVDNTITRLDAVTGKVVATITVGRGPQVYTTPGAVWSANYFNDSYMRIDPHSNAVVATLGKHLGAESVVDLAGSVWLCDAGGSPALTRLDPATWTARAEIDLTSAGSSTFCVDAVPLGTSLYVVTDGGRPPQVVDPGTGRATETVAESGGAQTERGVVGSANGTWLIDTRLGVFRLDPATGRPAAQLSLDGATGIADDGQSVWVMSNSGTLYRVTPSAPPG